MAAASSPPAILGREGLEVQINANRYRGFALAVATAVVVGAVVGLVTGVGVALIVGLLAGIGTAMVVAAGVWWAGAPLALALAGANPTHPVDQPRAHNLLDSLCAGAGVAKPRLAVVDHPSIDVMAVGRSPAHATLVVTSALLSSLSLVEMEAMLAHQVVRIKADDTCPATAAVAGPGALAVLVPWAARLAERAARSAEAGVAGRRRASGTNGVGGVSGVRAAGVRAAGRSGDYAADLAAVALTRYPPAMVSALEKVLASPPPGVPNPALSRAIGHLWTARPHLEDRIRALREL